MFCVMRTAKVGKFFLIKENKMSTISISLS